MTYSEHWRELPRYLPKRKIPDEVLAFIEQSQDSLCVACSGGSDSLALLLLTKLFWSDRTAIVLHYNHRIRAVSDEEERQIVDLARQLEIKIEVGRRPIPSEIHHSSETTSLQTTALCPEHATTAFASTQIFDAEKTANGSLKTNQSKVLPSEHNISHLPGALHPRTADTVPQPPEARSRTSDISSNSEHSADTTGNPGERASLYREISATACEQSRNLSSGNRKNLSGNHSDKAPANHPITFTPHPSLLRPDGSVAELPSEAELRALRYAFFEKMLRLHNSNILLLGHHADDRLETVLMRLVRGVGLEGLVAPRAIHGTGFYTKVRPLLNFSKNDIRQALTICGVPFFEDATNNDDGCLRNRIRHRLIPVFDEVFRSDWRDGFRCSCRLLSEQRDYLKQHLERYFADWDFSKKTFKRSALRALSIVESRTFFQTWLQRHNVRNVSTRTVDNLLSALHAAGSTVLSLNAEYRLQVSEKTISLTTSEPQPPNGTSIIWRNGTLFLSHNARLSFREKDCSPERYRQITSGMLSHDAAVALNAEAFILPCTVRFWRNGDRYRPLGAKQSVKVKDLFANRKIPIAQKHQRPVICSRNGDIAWIPGLPPAEAFKLTPRTKRCVFLFYQTDETRYSKNDGGKKDTEK